MNDTLARCPRRPAAWRPLAALATLGLALLAGVPAAQAQDVVLKNNQVTESALIDALAIDAPEAASGATRGFKPAVQPRAGATPAKPAGAGKANLLITFSTNSATLTTESQGALDTVARALQSDTLAGFTFRVEGHADARGDAERNLKLSQARAESVVAYLVAKHGILPERLQPQGKGASEPLNKDTADAPENRRVTIVTNRN